MPRTLVPAIAVFAMLTCRSALPDRGLVVAAFRSLIDEHRRAHLPPCLAVGSKGPLAFPSGPVEPWLVADLGDTRAVPLTKTCFVNGADILSIGEIPVSQGVAAVTAGVYFSRGDFTSGATCTIHARQVDGTWRVTDRCGDNIGTIVN